MDEYFCPNCGATLNCQDGFDPSLGVWTCTECGQLLMDDDVYDGDTFEGVAWYCDDCGALLNKQYGFSDSYGTWTCTECGHTNGINEDEIIDGEHFTCPECGATLNNQFGFNAYDDDWECSSCGAKLTHSYSDDDYSVVEEEKYVVPIVILIWKINGDIQSIITIGHVQSVVLIFIVNIHQMSLSR
ncbi:MAG: hypothetical protein E7C03_01375 [Anaerococcus sp.]|nr:hypothetical protein [Anaerococcus sp.]